MTASACYGDQNQGNFVAGVGDYYWENRAACGKLIDQNQGVPQPCLGEITMVKIVDHNPGAGKIINLSASAFATIADPNA